MATTGSAAAQRPPDRAAAPRASPGLRRSGRATTLPAAAGAHTLLDYSTLDGRDNLAQAIVMRLLTPRGELAELGHPEYGSRLNELLGAPNTETRAACEALRPRSARPGAADRRRCST